MSSTEEQVEELRQRYLANQVATASPAQRLLMLFDQLLRDLQGAQQAFEGADLKLISDRLVHAQQILAALRDPLDRSEELGRALDSLYGFCISQLVRANFDKNAALIPPVRKMIEQVASANRSSMVESTAEVRVSAVV